MYYTVIVTQKNEVISCETFLNEQEQKAKESFLETAKDYGMDEPMSVLDNHIADTKAFMKSAKIQVQWENARNETRVTLIQN